MNEIFAQIKSIIGEFFVKDTSGVTKALEIGDLVKLGSLVYAKETNSVDAQLVMVQSQDGSEVVLGAKDTLTIEESADNSTTTFDDRVYNDEEVVEEDDATVQEEETEGGESKKASQDDGAVFANRNGDMVDVNSGLRDSKFKKHGQVHQLEDRFEHESDRRLEPIDRPLNTIVRPPERPTSTITPPPPPEPPKDKVPNKTPIVIPTVSVDDLTTDEHNGLIKFTISSDNIIGSDIIINYRVYPQSAQEGSDFVATSGSAIIVSGKDSVEVSVEVVDDFYAEESETFRIVLEDISLNARIDDGIGIGTILDNGTPDEPIVERDNPDSPNTPNGYDSEDTLYVKLENDSIVNEGDTLVHTLKLLDAEGSPVALYEGESITVNLLYTADSSNPALEAVDYTATQSVVINGTLQGVSSVEIQNPTLDDIFTENIESYELSIESIIDNNNSFENIFNDGAVVNGSIVDDALGASKETTQVVLIALDTNGNVILDGNGNYVFANTTLEDGNAQYKALAFSADETVFASTTQLGMQLGSVIVATQTTGLTTATSDVDFESKTLTIALDTPFSVVAIDDFISDSGETFEVVINSYVTPTSGTTYEDVVVNTTAVTTTITDNSNPNTPNDDADGSESSVESVIIKVFASDASGNALKDGSGNYLEVNEVAEGGDAYYVALAFAPDTTTFNDTTKLDTQDGTVTFTFSDDSATRSSSGVEGSNDYLPQTTLTGITLGSTVTAEALDDYIADNGETFEVSISNYASPTTPVYEDVVVNTTAVTTTITDDTGTPNTSNDGPETIHEAVIIKLVACDASGSPIFEADGKTFTYTNDAQEGDVAQYMAVAFAPGETVFTTDTQVASDGTVRVSFANGSATGAASQGSTLDGSKDFDNDTQTVNVGTAFSVAIFDDYLKEGEHDYTASLVSGSYTPSTPTSGYENVSLSSDVVTTTISDDEAGTPPGDKTPNEITDTVYVKILGTPSVTEGGDLTHTLSLLDENDNAVTIPSRKTLTVTLEYTSSNGVVDGDFTTIVKEVIFTNGSTQNFTNVTLDDFTGEGTENYTVTITNVVDNDAYFENVDIHADASTTGTILDGVYIGTPVNGSVDEDNFVVTNANSTLTTTQSLSIVAATSENSYSLAFDGNPTFTSDDNAYVKLTSNGTAVEYVVSGATTTAYAGSGRADADRVFVITLNKNAAGGSNDSYTYTQYQNIDHPTANSDDNVVLTFNFRVTDGGVTSPAVSFNVTVNDSLPSSTDQTLSVDEDGTELIVISNESFTNGEITLNNGVAVYEDVSSGTSINIYDVDANDIVGSLKNNGDGTLTFTPNANYSGATHNVVYIVTDADGDTSWATLNLSVNPIADTAAITTADVTTTEDNANTEEGSNSVALGLNLPALSADTTDQNSVTPEDAPERLGYITLTFTNGTSVAGAILELGDTVEQAGNTIGDDIVTIATNDQELFIVIVDSSGNLDTNYHYTGLATSGANVVALTASEYEALKIIPAEDNDRDIGIDISVTSYEVNDSGTPLSTTDSDLYETTTQSMDVIITAQTDAITLEWDSTSLGVISTTTSSNDTYTFNNINEGNGTIDLQNLISKTSGYITDTSGDLDGSEKRTYTITGVPPGSLLIVGGDVSGEVATTTPGEGGQVAVANASGVATIVYNYTYENLVSDGSNIDNNPEFILKLPTEYSGTFSGTITLRVEDIDVDTNIADTAQIVELFFTLTVDPVADQATLSISQPKGLEDAGRGDALSDVIDEPSQGITIPIDVESSDKDGSETFTVTIAEIPDGGHIYYNGRLYNENGLVTTNANTDETPDSNITVDATGTGWKIVIEEYDLNNPPKYIPVHNNDTDVTLQVSAFTVDNGVASMDIATLAINVQVAAVADNVVNNELNAIDRDADASDDGDNIYALVLNEDNSGTVINLEEVYSNVASLDSYDNTTDGGAYGSESVTLVITGLSSEFTLSGATFFGGSGDTRKWVVSKDDIDQVNITTAGSFAGEVDFEISYITTEEAGVSKTSAPQDIKVLVKPVAEAGLQSATSVLEDTLTKVNLSLIADDTDEELHSIAIKMSDVTNKDFTLFVDGANINTLSNDGTYYLLTPQQADALYVLYGSDLGSTSDTNFEVKFITTDRVTTLSDGNGDLVDISAEQTLTHTLSLSAVTDNISIDVNGITSISGTNVTVTENAGVEKVSLNGTGDFSVSVDVTALTNDNTDADLDGSEKVTHIVLRNVPAGVVVNGGEMGVSNGESYWFVDITDVVLDGTNDTFDITFSVMNELDYGIGDSSEVTITAYSQDSGAALTSAQTTIVLEDNMNNVDPGNGGGAYTLVEANLAQKSFEVIEDTSFTLADILSVTPDSNDGVGDNSHDGAYYSVTIKNSDNVSISGADYSVNGDYIIVGTKDTIDAKLAAVTLTPVENRNENNDSGAELTLDAQLTTYMLDSNQRNYSQVETFTDSEITPVTDSVTTTQTITTDAPNGSDTLEDGTYTINIGLNSIDNPYVTYVQGAADSSAVTTLTLDYNSTFPGELSWSGGSQVLTNGSSVSVPFSQIDNLTFTPDTNKHGSVNFSYKVYTIEDGASNIVTSNGSFTLNVQAVADGLDAANLDTTGVENSDPSTTEYIALNIGTTLIDSDGSESLISLFVDGVPNGFLIYTGDSGSEVLAQNMGSSASGGNTWNIPVSGTTIPKVWIVAPDYWSGSESGFSLVSYVSDASSVQKVQTQFTLDIDPVASALSIEATNSFADNYVWSDININANMSDLDGSETLTLKLSGASVALDATMQFQLQDGGSVNASFNAGEWTLSDIGYDDINNIQLLYHAYNETINVSAFTVDGTDTLTPVSDSFILNIASTPTTGNGDDTILTDGNFTINTGTGTDTITLTQDAVVDFSKLDNIEILDLSGNGSNETITITLDDVLEITDGDNILTITGDNGDSVTVDIDTSLWSGTVTDNGTTHIYEYTRNSDSKSITLTVDDHIDSTVL